MRFTYCPPASPLCPEAKNKTMNLTITATIPEKGEGANKRRSPGRSINDCINDVYRVKYRENPYFEPVIGARARSGTVKVMPRDISGR